MMKNIFIFSFLMVLSASCSLNTMSIQEYEGILDNPDIDGSITNTTPEPTPDPTPDPEPTPEPTPTLPPVLNTSVYYGRSLLSSDEQKAYDYIFNLYRNFESNKDIYNDTAHRVYYNFEAEGIKVASTDRLNKIFSYIRNDHPEFYQASTSAARDAVIKNGYITTAYNKPMIGAISRAQFDVASQEIEAQVVRMLATLKPGMTDAQKVRALHNVFLENVNYSMSMAARIADAYGSLVQQKAVCEGYARGFTYLLQRAGIKAFYDTGEMLLNETTQNWGLHAWVIINLDGGWYVTDITSDDGIGGGYHYSYFLMGSTEFYKGYRYIDATGRNQAAYDILPTFSPTNYPLAATAF
ncbi:MAG: transglutaminase domain-containing protein [Brevinema sp.]